MARRLGPASGKDKTGGDRNEFCNAEWNLAGRGDCAGRPLAAEKKAAGNILGSLQSGAGPMFVELLLEKQNEDGGWPYSTGGSWTEPSVYATLALLAAGGEDAAAQRGIGWILRTAQHDRGWASRPGIGDSSWVTALVTLLPEDRLPANLRRGAIEWLLDTRGEDTTAANSLRDRLLGRKPSVDLAHPGWPWTQGAAAWVGPTAVAVIALERENRLRPDSRVAERAKGGQEFLLGHMCAAGGWNHGANSAWGYDMPPYPETTGMALLALRGMRDPKLDRAIQVAVQFLSTRSADAQNWLRMGLSAQGRLPQGYRPPQGIAYRTVPENALAIIADHGGLVA